MLKKPNYKKLDLQVYATFFEIYSGKVCIVNLICLCMLCTLLLSKYGLELDHNACVFFGKYFSFNILLELSRFLTC